MKRGVTLIELVVSMAIFTVIATVAVGAFVTVTKTKSLTNNMRESQQKSRIAIETISRLSRQATTVTIPNQKTLDLTFTNNNPVRFEITEGGLKYYKNYVNSGSAYEDLFAGTVRINTDSANSGFKKNTTNGTPELDIEIKGVITNIGNNPYYSDDFQLSTSVPLEQIK
jgi:prepilin-type N-terminal cleavage/methylation domain-containing protein